MGILHEIGFLNYLEEIIFIESAEEMPTHILALTALFRDSCCLTIKP